MCLSASDGINLGIGVATIFVSAVSCVVAIWAILLTKKEIRIQNERDLLEKRLNNFIACRTVCDSVRDSMKLLPINEQKDERLELEPLFLGLLGHGFLRKGRVIIKDSLEDENRDLFLKNVESVKNMADFLIAYEKTLMAMLKYQELMDDNEEYPLMAKAVHDAEYAMEVKRASKDLKMEFDALKQNKVLDKMYSEIEISKI